MKRPQTFEELIAAVSTHSEPISGCLTELFLRSKISRSNSFVKDCLSYWESTPRPISPGTDMPIHQILFLALEPPTWDAPLPKVPVTISHLGDGTGCSTNCYFYRSGEGFSRWCTACIAKRNYIDPEAPLYQQLQPGPKCKPGTYYLTPEEPTQ